MAEPAHWYLRYQPGHVLDHIRLDERWSQGIGCHTERYIFLCDRPSASRRTVAPMPPAAPVTRAIPPTATILLLWASCHVNTYLRFDDVGPSHMAAVARASISAGTRPKISSHLRCRNVSFSVELVSLPGAPVSPDEAAPSMVYRAPQVFDSERITSRPHPECRQSQVPPRPAHRAVGHSRSGLGKAIDR